MTETKRFLIDDAGELIDLKNFKFIDYGDECCKLLNKLHEENERLKKYNNKLMKQPLLFDVQTIPNTMEIMEANNKLEEENEQLKQSYKEFEDECQFTFNAMNRTQNVLYHKNFKLKEEIEQLKQHNIELINKIDFLERVIDGDVGD